MKKSIYVFLTAWAALACFSAAQAQTTLRVDYDSPSQSYRVWAKSAASYSPPQSRFVNVFVTVVVPHGTGAALFNPSNIATNTALAGGGATNLFTVSRYNAPSENTVKDYLFFNMDVGNAAYTPITIAAGTEFLLFTFQSQNGCLGNISLMDPANDPFKKPNTESINAGHAFSILGAGGDTYSGIYGAAAATCSVAPTVSTAISSPLTVGQNGTLTMTVTNPAGNPAQSGIGYTYKLPAGLTFPAGAVITNSCGGAATVSGGNTLTFTGGNIIAGASTCTITAPITPTAAGTVDPATGSFPSVAGVVPAANNGAGTATSAITVNASCAANAGVLSY